MNSEEGRNSTCCPKKLATARLARTVLLTAFSVAALMAVACTGHSESGSGAEKSGQSDWVASQSLLPGASTKLAGTWYGVIKMIDPPERVGPNPLGSPNPNLPDQMELPVFFLKKNERITINPPSSRSSVSKLIDWYSRVVAPDHIQVKNDSVASSGNSQTLWFATEEDFRLNGDLIDGAVTVKISNTPQSDSYLLLKYRGKLNRLTDAQAKALIDSYKALTESEKQKTGKK
jgi:hypothetical protein